MVVMESSISDLSCASWSRRTHQNNFKCAVEHSRGLKRIDHL